VTSNRYSYKKLMPGDIHRDIVCSSSRVASVGSPPKRILSKLCMVRYPSSVQGGNLPVMVETYPLRLLHTICNPCFHVIELYCSSRFSPPLVCRHQIGVRCTVRVVRLVVLPVHLHHHCDVRCRWRGVFRRRIQVHTCRPSRGRRWCWRRREGVTLGATA